jgi:hypothetical protein
MGPSRSILSRFFQTLSQLCPAVKAISSKHITQGPCMRPTVNLRAGAPAGPRCAVLKRDVHLAEGREGAYVQRDRGPHACTSTNARTMLTAPRSALTTGQSKKGTRREGSSETGRGCSSRMLTKTHTTFTTTHVQLALPARKRRQGKGAKRK